MDAAQKALEDAKAAAEKAAQEAADVAKQQYQEVRQMIDKADDARGAYEGTKIFGSKAEVDKFVDDVAREMKVDRAKALQMLEMDAKSWDAIKTAIKLPENLLGH